MSVVTGLTSGHRITPPKPPGTSGKGALAGSFWLGGLDGRKAVLPVSESPKPNPQPEPVPLPSASASNTVRQSAKTDRGRFGWLSRDQAPSPIATATNIEVPSAKRHAAGSHRSIAISAPANSMAADATSTGTKWNESKSTGRVPVKIKGPASDPTASAGCAWQNSRVAVTISANAGKAPI